MPPPREPASATQHPAHLLVLLRHAKSDWSGRQGDVDRPLAKRGRRQAAEAGRWLAAGVPHLDLAVVSPAARATTTWELVAAELETGALTRVDDRVYAASPGALLEVVRELPEDVGTAVLVGHNPGLEDLVELLTGSWLPMPTSAIAVLGIDRPWAALRRGAAAVRVTGRPPGG